jgi:hypothetical protein
MRSHAIVAVLALSAALVACGESADSPIKTGTTGSLDNPAVNVPMAKADRDTPPDPVPSTHAGPPQPDAAAANVAAAPTARDTPAAEPTKALTPSEEANGMPKPGQTDNHFTPSLDGAMKGSQQSPGNEPPPAAPAK